jgi:hypothetical protein
MTNKKYNNINCYMNNTLFKKRFTVNSKQYGQIDTIGEGAQGAVYKVINL